MAESEGRKKRRRYEVSPNFDDLVGDISDGEEVSSFFPTLKQQAKRQKTRPQQQHKSASMDMDDEEEEQHKLELNVDDEATLLLNMIEPPRQMQPQPGDEYFECAYYPLSTPMVPDFLDTVNEYIHTKGDSVIKNFLVARVDGIFSSFFTLLHLLPTVANEDGEELVNEGEKLNILATQRAVLNPAMENEAMKRRKAFDSMAKKINQEMVNVTSILGGTTAAKKRFEVVIPMFGCEPLYNMWNAFEHPFDVSAAVPDFRFKSGSGVQKELLRVAHSGCNDANKVTAAAAIGGKINATSLFRTTFSRLRGLVIEFNTSALARLLATDHTMFNRLSCANYLRTYIKYKLGGVFKQDDAYRNVINDQAYSQQVRPEAVVVAAANIELAEETRQTLDKRLKIQLYPYQLEAVAWMMSVEAKQAPTDTAHLIKIDQQDRLLFDVVANQPVATKDQAQLQSIPYKGGLLADEMGLGKTVEMLSLAIANPSPPLPLNDDAVLAEDDTKFAFIHSRATLVVAPNHLVIPVWKKIFNESMRSGSLLTITTKYDFERITVKQLKEVDLVVVSAEFLDGDSHLHAKHAKLDGASMNPSYSIYRRTELYCQKQSQTLRELLTTKGGQKRIEGLYGLPLYLFKWHRLIIDESHKLLSEHSVAPMLEDFVTSTHTWCITGTPFTTHEGVARMCRMLGVFDTTAATEHQIQNNYFTIGCRIPVLPNKLMWRSTKKGVKTQLSIPTMVEYIHVLDFTPTERMLYTRASASQNIQAMRELCCQVRAVGVANAADDPNAVQHRTLDEVSALLIQSRQTRLREVQATHKIDLGKLERKREKLDRALNDVSNPIDANVLDQKMMAIAHIEKTVGEAQREVDVLEREIAYFEMALAIRTSVKRDETTGKNVIEGHSCPVCYEDAMDTPALTSCGHLFCNACIQRCKQTQGKCAVCRKALTTATDILPIALNQDVIHEGAELLVNQYGTKMGNLIHHLRQMWAEAPEEKVIIFSSRNDDMLKLSQFLAREEIATVICRGNVHMRNKAFAEFNNPEGQVRVMMLSLDNGAAGSNLTAASEIILLDSLWDGTQAQQVSSELQALNRAHRVGQTKKVRIVRMLIRDTVETERFRQHNHQFDATKSLTVRDMAVDDL
jgi:SNF2 family DNA or RNA helicase